MLQHFKEVKGISIFKGKNFQNELKILKIYFLAILEEVDVNKVKEERKQQYSS